MGHGTQLRVRGFLASWGWLVALGLVLGVALGGWATYTAVVDPGTTEEVVESDVYSVDTSFSHEATVQRDNPVFDNGTVLRNRSTYLTALSPRFDGTYEVRYAAAHDEAAEITVDRTMVIQAVQEDQVIWRNETPAGPPLQQTVQPGETVAAKVSINATRFDLRREAIVDQIGTTPGETTLAIEFVVSSTSEVAGEPARIRLVDRVPVTVDGDSYSVARDVGSGDAITRQQVNQVPVTYSPLLRGGGPVLLLVSFVLLGIGIQGYREGLFELTPEEQSALSYFDQRAEFDEWIVETAVPSDFEDRETVEAETLADLVDFAIDSNVAALEDTDSDVVYAVTSDVALTYHPPASIRRDRETIRELLTDLVPEI